MSESNICIRYTRVDLEMYQGAYRASFQKLDSRMETIGCLQRVFDRQCGVEPTDGVICAVEV